MANDPPQKLYWDSCIFLAYIEGEGNRLPTVSALLDDCQNGKLEICTSILTITEVAFTAYERKKKALSAKAEARIDALWSPPSQVKLVEVHQFFARDARKLMRKAITKGLSLKPNDALHLATALKMNSDQFHTYDSRLEKYGELFEIDVGPPITDSPALPFSDS